MSKRNNNDRLGAPGPGAPVPPPALETENSIFSFVTPTEFVELPSKGKYYAEDHPLNGTTTVEIKHMTAKEEDILTSAALVKNGLAIDRLLQSTIMDKTIDVNSLLLGDKNALLIASRITGYGPHYDVSTRCPSCYEKEDHSFNLEDIQEAPSEIPEGVENLGGGLFSLMLPTTGVTLVVKLLTSGDESRLAKALTAKKKVTEATSPVTDLLKAVIVSVNDVTKPSMVYEFIELMPLDDVRTLRTAYEKIKPDVDLKLDFTCSSCAYEGGVTMPLTAKFFWPHL